MKALGGTLKIGSAVSARVATFTASDALSEVPVYRATLPLEDGDPEDWIGQSATCSIAFSAAEAPETARAFAGVVMEAARHVAAEGSEAVTVTFQPWLGLLALTRDCRVYQNLTSVEILADILERRGLRQKKRTVSARPAKREFCVQYDESDLDFVLRLFSEDGIGAYFDDGAGPETLILHDCASAFPALGRPSVTLADPFAGKPDHLTISGIERAGSLTAGQLLASSYDAGDAKRVDASAVTMSRASAAKALARYHYHAALAGGTAGAAPKAAAGAARTGDHVLRGRCRHPGLFVGQTFAVEAGRDRSHAGDWRIRRLDYTLRTAGQGAEFSVALEAVAKTAPLYPPPREKKRIAGIHNAVVSGKSAAMPASDAEGRVKVRFLWDRDGEGSETSCWVRVATPLAGSGYGMQFLPRAGQEVLVGFLNGDPDAPVIVGSVPNGRHKVPFATAGTTRSGLRSKLDGKTNEIAFEDGKDKEAVQILAGNDYVLSVGRNATRTVTENETTEVKKDAGLTVGQNRTVAVTGDQKTSAKAVTVDAEGAVKIEAASISLTATDSITLKVGGNVLKIGQGGIEVSGTKVEAAAKSSLSLSGLNVDVAAKSGLSLAGKAQASMTSSGALKLSGLTIDAAAQVKATLKASVMTEISGSAMSAVKGGLVKIN